MLAAKMQWLSVCILVTYFYGGGGVTKTSGIDQFWTDDYKVFDQIYGKTSDKEIYGVSLPPTVSFTGLKKQALEKKEKYKLDNDKDLYTLESIHHDIAGKSKEKKKPASSHNFISSNNFKPISQDIDPETYNYLKHLEDYEKERKLSKLMYGGLSPYAKYEDPKDTEGYKSIQDILDAHETKSKRSNEVKNPKKGKNKRNKTTRFRNNTPNQRCVSGRCRNRNKFRSARPYVRRVKHTYV